MSTHTYVTVDEFVAYVHAHEAVELSDLYDPLNSEINSDKVTQSLISASREADSYLRNRYATPIAPTPFELKQPVMAIARYRLSNLDRESRIRLDYEDAIRFLQQVAKGLATLDLVAGDAPVAPVQGVFSKPSYVVDLEGF